MRSDQRCKRLPITVLLILCLFVGSMLTACSQKKAETADTTAVTEEAAQVENTQPTKAPEVTAPAEVATTEATPSEFVVPEDFSLYKAYKDDFLIGTIYTDASRSGKDMELTLKHFNAITPENIMKPEYMQPQEGSFDYKNSDVMVSFAKEQGLNVVGHTLAWHQQTGNWLGRNVSREEAIEQLKSHITNIVGKYKGQIISWDVVNEAINDGATLPADGDWTKCLRQTQWSTSIGSDYMAMAFTFAHEADPDVKLYYNDYNLNDKKKADIVYAMVKDLKGQGVPIDGIGMQGHYTVDTSVGSVEYSLKKFSELGVEVSITELDLGVNGAAATGLTEEQEIKQGIAYAKLFQLFKKYKDTIARVTFWGYVDNRSWRADRYPCLFNADYSPKLAAYAVYDPEAFLAFYQKSDRSTVSAKTAEAKYGTPVLDGEMDALWDSCTMYPVDNQLTAWEGATGDVRLAWDEKFVYVLMEVKDTTLNHSSANAYEQDSVELYLDQKNEKNAYYDDNDGQYRINYIGEESFGTIPNLTGFDSVAKEISGGYVIEVAIPLMEKASADKIMGFEAQINDSNQSGVRQSIAKFNDLTDNSYQSTDLWGNLKLVK